MRVKLHNETGQRIITSGQRIGHEFAGALQLRRCKISKSQAQTQKHGTWEEPRNFKGIQCEKMPNVNPWFWVNNQKKRITVTETY